ncbi:MAG: hypothetical protein AAF680_05660 [Pseudomonadota bacterium]
MRALICTLLSMSLVAEARLVRGGGRGNNTIIEDVTFAGTTPFLISSSLEPAALNGSDLVGSAAYGFGPIGSQIGINHDYGRDCALMTDCSFELGASELLNWEAKIIGLPPVLAGDEYPALADLRITWEMRAVEGLPPGLISTGPRPSRSLGPDFIWSSLFSASNDGSYALGVGSPSVMLGESLGYLPGPDEFSGCYSPRPSSGVPSVPAPLSIEQAYSYSDCRTVSLDLAQEATAPTGADAQALLEEFEYLSLFVTAELIAPDGFEFASFFEEGGPRGVPATLLENIDSIPTVEELLLSDSLEYFGCSALPSSDCTLFRTSSDGLRITVVADVPSPATALLIATGFGYVFTRRRRQRSLRTKVDLCGNTSS